MWFWPADRGRAVQDGEKVVGAVPKAGHGAAFAEPPAVVAGWKRAAGDLLLDDAFLQALEDPARRAGALQAKSRAVLAIPQPGRRFRAFALMMSFAQKGDLAAIHEGMRDLEKTHGLFPAEYEEMMQRMSEVDGTAVMARLSKEMGVGRPLLHWQRRCVANWAGADSTAAVQWWNELPDGTFRNSCASPLIEGLAWQDAAKAWELAQHLEPEHRADATWLVAAEMAKQQGVQSAAQWLAGLSEENYNGKMGVLRKLVDFVRHQPAETKRAVIDQFQNEPWALQSDSFGALGEDWGRTSGAEAAEWANALSQQARQRALPRVVRSWAQVNPREAAQWVTTQQQSPLYPRLRHEFINQVRQTNPQDLQTWEAELPAPSINP